MRRVELNRDVFERYVIYFFGLNYEIRESRSLFSVGGVFYKWNFLEICFVLPKIYLSKFNSPKINFSLSEAVGWAEIRFGVLFVQVSRSPGSINPRMLVS